MAVSLPESAAVPLARRWSLTARVLAAWRSTLEWIGGWRRADAWPGRTEAEEQGRRAVLEFRAATEAVRCAPECDVVSITARVRTAPTVVADRRADPAAELLAEAQALCAPVRQCRRWASELKQSRFRPVRLLGRWQFVWDSGSARLAAELPAMHERRYLASLRSQEHAARQLVEWVDGLALRPEVGRWTARATAALASSRDADDLLALRDRLRQTVDRLAELAEQGRRAAEQVEAFAEQCRDRQRRLSAESTTRRQAHLGRRDVLIELVAVTNGAQRADDLTDLLARGAVAAWLTGTRCALAAQLAELEAAMGDSARLQSRCRAAGELRAAMQGVAEEQRWIEHEAVDRLQNALKTRLRIGRLAAGGSPVAG